MSLMMIEYEGRMMSTEEVLRLKNSTKEVIETPLETIKEEVETKEVIETPIIETPLVVKEELVSEVDELELAKQEYFKIFGKKPNPNI
jgi:hypothetical protein